MELPLTRTEMITLKAQLELALAVQELNAEEDRVAITLELPLALVEKIDAEARSAERKRATQIRWVLKQHYEAKA